MQRTAAFILLPLLVLGALTLAEAASAQLAPNTVPESSSPDPNQSAPGSPNAIGGNNPFESLPQPGNANQDAAQMNSSAPSGSDQADDQKRGDMPSSGNGSPDGDNPGSVPTPAGQPQNDPGLARDQNQPPPASQADGSVNPDERGQGAQEQSRDQPRQEFTRPIIKSKDDSPMRQALNDILSGNYSESLIKLDKIIEINPRQLQAHYLKAVALVWTRHYRDAEAEYRLILKAEPASQLAKMADKGLTKLGR